MTPIFQKDDQDFMSNKYGIPDDDLKKIRERDKTCVYCRKTMIDSGASGWRGDWATIEHLNFLPPWNDPATIAICCWSCNSSRGDKKLSDWFKTSYCKEKNINEKTETEPVKEYVRFVENFVDCCVWRFAKTMPRIPHYYVVRDELSGDVKKTFDAFGEYIKKNGYTAKFYSKQYTYFNIGNYKYWVDENILNRATLGIENN